MVIKDCHVKDFYNLAKKSGNNAMEYLFQKIFPTSPGMNQEFSDYLLTMMAKTRATGELNIPNAKSLLVISRVVLWILGPVWIAGNFCLPATTLDQFRQRISNEERTDWDKYFSQFGQHNALWQECINDSLNRLGSITDKVVAGRITRFFLESSSFLETETKTTRPA